MQLKTRHGKYSAECFYTDPDTGKRRRVLRATGIRDDGTDASRRTAEHRGREIEAELNGALGAARARSSRRQSVTTLRLAHVEAVAAATLAGKGARTLDNLNKGAEHLMRALGVDRDPYSIGDEHIIEYARNARKKRAPATVLLELDALRRMLRAAKVDPLPKFPTVGGVRPRELAFTADELKRLLEHVSAGRVWSELWPSRVDYLRMYAGLGLSYNELYGIEPEGINWTKHTVRVRGTKRETRDRTMPMSPSVEAVLRRAEKLMRKRADGVLFPRWSKKVLNQALAQAAQRAGLIAAGKPCGTNVLRASFCTQLVRANVHPKKIAMLMGHSTSKTADRWYARLRADEDLHDAVAALPAL